MPLPPPTDDRIFISYNHGDRTVAAAVKAGLEARGIAVLIDDQDMRPGQNIRDFVTRSVSSSASTLCIVSPQSLVSGWVAQESVLALAARDLWVDRAFVAGYLTDDFLDNGFRLAATRSVDERLSQLNADITRHVQNSLDLSDLAAEHTRLIGLRHQLGQVLEHLRACLCLDLRPSQMDRSLTRIAEEHRRRRKTAPLCQDLLELREEIRALLAGDQCMPAMKRFLDLVRNFANDQRMVDAASRLHGDLHSVTSEKRALRFTEYRKMRNEILDAALDMMNKVVAEAYAEAPHA